MMVQQRSRRSLVVVSLVLLLAGLALPAPAGGVAAAPPLPAPAVPSSTPPKSAPRRDAVATTYWVGTTADNSTASDCTTQGNSDCSLRQAVALANANTGVMNTIDFNIPGGGVRTITLLSPVFITNPVVMNGYTEPGASVNTLASGTNAVLTVRVDGNNASINGLLLQPGSDGSTIKGLSITGFSSTNSGVTGITMQNNNSVIAGNWIGVAPDGTAYGNFYGVGPINGGGTRIGGTTPADRNLISGNQVGVDLYRTSNNLVEGNLIGTNAAGTGPLGNDRGVAIDTGAANNVIGGTGAGQANVIAYNSSYSVLIGFNAADTTTVGNTVRGNLIHDNGSGILLNGEGTNDHCDADTGPNNFQNSPVLAASLSAGVIQITGTLDSTASRTFHMDFYASPPSAGQGQTYLGSTDVATGAGCTTPIIFIAPALPGQEWITATATDATTGDTSQFSAPVIAVQACVVNSTQDPSDASKLTLRDTVGLLNNGGCTNSTVTFDPTVFPVNGTAKVTLNSGIGTLPLLDTSGTIDGSNAGVTVDGGNAVTVFLVFPGVTETLNALTIQHGNAGGGNGGGIANHGTLTVSNSTFSGNAANLGGGIYNSGVFDSPGTLTVTNSTFSGNTAGLGGGIADGLGATATVTGSTFIGNSAGNGNGGFSGTNNLIGDAATAGGFSDGMNGNIVGHPAVLGTLGRYGGTTETFPLLPGSPAINAGAAVGQGPANNPVPNSDQRGGARVGVPDIGAFESQGFSLTRTSGDSQATTVSTAFASPLSVTVASGHGEPVAGGQVTFTAPASGAAATFTGTPATISGSGGASVTATANGTAGSYSVTASAAGAPSATFTLTNTPSGVTGISPAAGNTAGGTSVTLTGVGFGTSANTQVVLDGVAIAAGKVTSVTGTQIVYVAPAHAAGSVTVSVTVNGTALAGSATYTYGTVTALPGPKPSGPSGAPPNALPVTRPPGTTAGPAPNPLPAPRP